MKPDRDVERLLDRWFAEGPMEVPDRVIDVVADRIGRQSQRPTWRFLWKGTHVNTPIRFAAAAAAILIAGVIGFSVLGRPSDSGIGTPPTPTPIVTGSPSPSPTPGVSCEGGPCLGPLAAGSFTATEPLRPFSYSVPEGWENLFNTAGGYVLQEQARDSIYHNAIYVFLDLQAADQTCTRAPAPGVGQSVDEMVAWLAALPGLSMTPPTAISLGGLDGVTFDLTFSAGGRLCQAETKLWVQEWSGDPNFWWGFGAGYQERVLLLDRGSGGTVFIILDGGSSDFETFAASAMPIVESFDFSP
jgi:hypothetical protein